MSMLVIGAVVPSFCQSRHLAIVNSAEFNLWTPALFSFDSLHLPWHWDFILLLFLTGKLIEMIVGFIAIFISRLTSWVRSRFLHIVAPVDKEDYWGRWSRFLFDIDKICWWSVFFAKNPIGWLTALLIQFSLKVWRKISLCSTAKCYEGRSNRSYIQISRSFFLPWED